MQHQQQVMAHGGAWGWHSGSASASASTAAGSVAAHVRPWSPHVRTRCCCVSFPAPLHLCTPSWMHLPLPHWYRWYSWCSCCYSPSPLPPCCHPSYHPTAACSSCCLLSPCTAAAAVLVLYMVGRWHWRPPGAVTDCGCRWVVPLAGGKHADNAPCRLDHRHTSTLHAGGMRVHWNWRAPACLCWCQCGRYQLVTSVVRCVFRGPAAGHTAVAASCHTTCWYLDTRDNGNTATPNDHAPSYRTQIAVQCRRVCDPKRRHPRVCVSHVDRTSPLCERGYRYKCRAAREGNDEWPTDLTRGGGPIAHCRGSGAATPRRQPPFSTRIAAIPSRRVVRAVGWRGRRRCACCFCIRYRGTSWWPGACT